MKKQIKTRRPSFPSVALDKPLSFRRRQRWQVICGDKNNYRVGIYSPEVATIADIREFERHSCDEFFILLEGKASLALMTEKRGKQQVRVVPLKPLKPMLVRTWHAGFCPDGPFTGVVLVVERDQFTTWMQPVRSTQALNPVTGTRDQFRHKRPAIKQRS